MFSNVLECSRKMVNRLCASQVSVAALFDRFDVDGGGSISFAEMSDGLRKMDLNTQALTPPPSASSL
jgi:Ca2+-binding EF-hand superfamily protein